MIPVAQPRKRPRVPSTLAILVALLVQAAPYPAQARTSDPVVSPRMTVRLVTDGDPVAGQPLRVGLQMQPAPGWHTYWHNPGDAGAAPTFTLAATPHAAIGAIGWPLPQRLTDQGVTSFGYDSPVVLTRTILPTATPLMLTATATWLVCRTICVPERGTFQLQLPATIAAAPDQRWPGALIPPTRALGAHVTPDATLFLPVPPGDPVTDFLPDAPDTTNLDQPPRIHVRGGLLTLELTPTVSFLPTAPLTGVLVQGTGSRRTGIRIAATPAPAPTSMPPGSSMLPALLAALLAALAGGLLLNLMPCVFPILAMKAMSLARLGGASRRQVRTEALAYTAGVLVCVLSLAALLLALRAAGMAAGWGFQFQWPRFVAAMAWLFFGIGLNLSGALAIGGAWTGAGHSLAARGGLAGSFATGLLAVLVATPCTAPFMGIAMAAALASGAAQALGIFAALGIGLALPWLALAAVPAAAARLPRPGPWMEHLRQILAFPMYAAAVWLVWVLVQQSGPAAVLTAGAGCVLIALAAWIARITAHRFVPALLCAAALAALLTLATRGTPAATAPQTAARFTPGRLAQLRDAGHPVLVNMTAAWCVTCLVNERLALRPALPRLATSGVAYLQGDWTTQNPDITAFLHQYGRAGVPLYVFYPPHQPGRVLPQLLTPGLIAALAEH